MNPTDPAATGTWDQAPVKVTITTGTVTQRAGGARRRPACPAGGGYAVEVVGADGTRRLVAVSLGLFDDADGLVQVPVRAWPPASRWWSRTYDHSTTTRTAATARTTRPPRR